MVHRRSFGPQTVRGVGSAVRHASKFAVAAHAAKTVGKISTFLHSRKQKNHFRKGVKRSVNVVSRALTGRSLISEDIGAGGEFTKKSVTFNLCKHMSAMQMTQKLVASNKQEAHYRFSGIQPFMNTTTPSTNITMPSGTVGDIVGGGYFPLINFSSSNPGLNTSNYVVPPLQVYDVTSLNNYVNNSYTSYSPCFQPAFLCRSNINSYQPYAVSFQNLYGMGPSGISSSNTVWTNEDTPGQTANNVPLRRDMLNYVSAKLMCYGAAQMATTFKVELVQLHDDFLHPDYIMNAGMSNLSSAYNQEQVAFWESYVSHSVKHPIASINPAWKKHCTVLKSISFVLQPRLSTETDAAVGHTKQLSIYAKLNRTCKYDWLVTSQDSNIESSGSFPISTSQNIQNVVAPRARIYLTVQATNVTYVPWGTSASVNFTPSYDMLLRTKHTMIE